MKVTTYETVRRRASRALIHVIGCAAAIAFLLVTTSCGGNKAEEPVAVARENVVSEAEARTYLDSLVASVQAGNAHEVCEIGHMSRPNCNGDPRTIALAPVHQPPPMVLSTRPVYTTACAPDGLVLVIKGNDDEGQEYVRDFQVVRHNTTGEPYARFSVYWISGTVSSSRQCG